MRVPITFDVDPLTPVERAALVQLAHKLWPLQHQLATRWVARLIELLPEYFPNPGPSPERLAELNEKFLALVFDHLRRDDIDAVYRAYYLRTAELIDRDLQRAPALRISLASLYTSAGVSLRVIAEALSDAEEPMLLAYRKLQGQLMMLVGQAYSDAREDYLQRVFEQINVLSHELRAPLSNLFGFLELLRAGEFGDVSLEQEAVLRQLLGEADDLLWLLGGTLDLSRLDTGRVELRMEAFALGDVVEEVVNAFPHLTVPVGCSVPDGLPLLRSDRLKVKQILRNLVRNAVRYGGDRVEVGVSAPSADWVEVEVRDHGPGIAPEDLQVIFEFFERGRGGGLARDGYGIGLHVVRRLVTLLGGTVHVESPPGEGARFRFRLPVGSAHSSAPKRSSNWEL